MINKKGNLMVMLLVIGGLLLLVMAGVIIAIGSSTVNWVMDETLPEIQDLGQDIGGWNSTDTVRIAIEPVDTIIQNFTWLAGVIYVLGLLGIFGLAYSFRFTGEKWLIGFFFALVFILVIGCIILSNVYEGVYNGDDELASIMKEHVLLSYLIIYSPAIMGLLSFLAGILLFSGGREGT